MLINIPNTRYGNDSNHMVTLHDSNILPHVLCFVVGAVGLWRTTLENLEVVWTFVQNTLNTKLQQFGEARVPNLPITTY